MLELYQAIPYQGAYHKILIEDGKIKTIESYRPLPPGQITDRLWTQGWERIFRALSVEQIRNGMYGFAQVQV